MKRTLFSKGNTGNLKWFYFPVLRCKIWIYSRIKRKSIFKWFRSNDLKCFYLRHFYTMNCYNFSIFFTTISQKNRKRRKIIFLEVSASMNKIRSRLSSFSEFYKRELKRLKGCILWMWKKFLSLLNVFLIVAIFTLITVLFNFYL